MDGARETNVLIIGSGIAGCSAALAASEHTDDVTLITKASRPEGGASTDWAQGGIAVTRDRPETLRSDIVAASAGTADQEAIDVLLEDADDAVESVLIDTLGVPFVRDDDEFDYAREAAHSEARILHVEAATGEHILRPFLSHLDDLDAISIHDDTAALDLIAEDDTVYGAMVDTATSPEPIFAGATVLATGGIGSLYSRSTNPSGSTGDGIAMAARAGATTADLEFVQFHPTGVDTAADEDVFLISEAVRGAGAILRNGEGERFMPDYHDDAELAPRDVVARAVDAERRRTGSVHLDVSDIAFAEQFPQLASSCSAVGIDPESGIPVAPTQHFICGGIDVDHHGRSSLDRLYAVGECARTGIHGANRLAGTSLLEGLVWGRRAGIAAVGHSPTVVDVSTFRDSDPSLPDRFAGEKFERLRSITDEYIGIRRTPDGLDRAVSALRRLKGEVDAYIRTRTSRRLYELHHATVTALLIAEAAKTNQTSVGCHYIEEEYVDH